MRSTRYYAYASYSTLNYVLETAMDMKYSRPLCITFAIRLNLQATPLRYNYECAVGFCSHNLPFYTITRLRNEVVCALFIQHCGGKFARSVAVSLFLRPLRITSDVTAQYGMWSIRIEVSFIHTEVITFQGRYCRLLFIYFGYQY